MWAVGMAIGVLLLDLTPGYNVALMSYLFGNILLVVPSDLWLIAGLDIIILTTVIFLYNRFQSIFFDEEFSELQGVRVRLYYFILLCLIALTVVILIYVVGLILVIALLTVSFQAVKAAPLPLQGGHADHLVDRRGLEQGDGTDDAQDLSHLR